MHLIGACGDGAGAPGVEIDALADWRLERRVLAPDETVILLTSPLHPYFKTATKGRGGGSRLTVSPTAGGAAELAAELAFVALLLALFRAGAMADGASRPAVLGALSTAPALTPALAASSC